MIGTSLTELLFIRSCIFGLRYTAPILVAASIPAITFSNRSAWPAILIGVPAVAESLFYLLVYVPKSTRLQKPAEHPPPLPRDERQRLFEKGHAQITDPEAFLSKWFQLAPLSEIKRDNVKEFFCWALLNKAEWNDAESGELDGYADNVEELLGRPLGQGRGSAVPLRLTIDPVPMQHRPLVWYGLVSMVDVGVYLYLTISGFIYYRLPLSKLFTVFPLRLHTLFSRNTTTSSGLSYYHRPHTSSSSLPILFIHGIGIGLYPYARFLAALHRSTRPSATLDGQTGIIALEIPQISARITSGLPARQDLCADIKDILSRHGWDRFVLASHSFGSVVAANMVKDGDLNGRIASMMFADPVAFLLQLPDVAYNFTRRPPRRANEYQLHYFASMDMLVAETLGRHFFWAENALWKEDLSGRNVTAALSGRDIVAPATAVGRYLAHDGREHSDIPTNEWKEAKWRGEGLEVLWYEHCDHAQMFDRRRDFERLVDGVRTYSSQGESAP